MYWATDGRVGFDRWPGCPPPAPALTDMDGCVILPPGVWKGQVE